MYEQGYQPPKKNKTPWGLIIGVFVGFCVLCCGGIFFVGQQSLSAAQPLTGCTFSMVLVKESIAKTAKESGKFPDAETWQTSIKAELERMAGNMEELPPVLKGMGIRPISASEPLVCMTGAQTTGIAYNSEIAGKAFGEVPQDAVVVFEVKESALNQSKAWGGGPSGTAPPFMGQPRSWMSIRLNKDSPDIQTGTTGRRLGQ
ncbi:MAG: hypothetical protein MUC92_11075 [Fimbriimonadaceae bacterium]|jgi:hypothetical protein|nr:hypothetical protein [Fimbriimonadaceae bacterium]